MTVPFTAEQLEQVIIAALGQGDIEGVDIALRLLAVVDPHRAQMVLDTMKLGVAMRRDMNAKGVQ